MFSNKRLAACNPHHADIPDIEGPIQWLQNIVIAVLKVIAIIPDWCLHWILKELTPAGRTMLRYSGGLRNTFFYCCEMWWSLLTFILVRVETYWNLQSSARNNGHQLFQNINLAVSQAGWWNIQYPIAKSFQTLGDHQQQGSEHAPKTSKTAKVKFRILKIEHLSHVQNPAIHF